MTIVQLRLRPPTMFWNLGPIELQRDRIESSPLINVERLTQRQIEVINRAIAGEEIFIYDAEGNRIQGSLSNINLISGNYISDEDIQEEPDIIPEVISVTVDDDVEEFEEDDEDYEEAAEALLQSHWNTVKKSIQTLDKSSYSLNLLHAALEIELGGKKRQGVITAIQDALKEQ